MVDGPLMLELEAQQADAGTAEDMDKEIYLVKTRDLN